MVNDCLGSCDVFVEQIQQRDAGNVLCLNFQVSIIFLFLPFLPIKNLQAVIGFSGSHDVFFEQIQQRHVGDVLC